MIDISHIPEVPGLSVFLPRSVDANSWQTWQKPRGFTMCSMYAIGPGGGGGAGGLGANASGGGGGGSGGISRLTIPLFLLPDTIYVRVTPGSSGGRTRTTAGTGEAGGVAFSAATSLVAIYPNTTAAYLFLLANPGGNGGGGIASSATAGVAGLAATIVTTADCPLANLGSSLFIAGNAGANGGANSAGTNITQGTGSQIYGGAGGGACASSSATNVKGGDITALSLTPFSTNSGGTSGNPGGVVGGKGSNGYSWSTIFPGKIYGGTGGGGSYNLQGGDAGHGCGIGAGGGGGGGGYSSAASPLNGRGGEGGPGCVIIQCW